MRSGMRGLAALALLAWLAMPAAGAPAASGAWARVDPIPAFGEDWPAAPALPTMGSALVATSPMVDDGALLAARGMGERSEKRKPKASGEAQTPARPRPTARRPHTLSGQRVRLMLQSLTVPGWGEANLGERRSALTFGLLELGVWGSFAAFRIQEKMREQTYERTARLFAGIDLGARDEEFRRVVGFYASNEEYNRLVVRRDATNLYFGDPAGYAAYVEAHELRGENAWSWNSDADLLRYRAERQATQRAVKHAHDALAAALINRLLSMIHASAGGIRRDAAGTSLRLECVPAGDDPMAFRLGMRADF